MFTLKTLLGYYFCFCVIHACSLHHADWYNISFHCSSTFISNPKKSVSSLHQRAIVFEVVMSSENSPNPWHWGKPHPTRGRQTHSHSWGCGCTCTGPPSDRKMVQTHTAWGEDAEERQIWEQMSFLELEKRLSHKGWKLNYRQHTWARKVIKLPSLKPRDKRESALTEYDATF